MGSSEKIANQHNHQSDNAEWDVNKGENRHSLRQGIDPTGENAKFVEDEITAKNQQKEEQWYGNGKNDERHVVEVVNEPDLALGEYRTDAHYRRYAAALSHKSLSKKSCRYDDGKEKQKRHHHHTFKEAIRQDISEDDQYIPKV